MENGKISQSAIAKIVGVDKSTVSVCLSNSPRANRISEGVRRRILLEAERLNYKPNFFASQLRHGKSKVILVCLNSFNDPHAGLLTEAFEQRASQRGYFVIISCLRGVDGSKERLDETVGRQATAAVALITGAVDLYSDAEIQSLLSRSKHLVLVSRTNPDPKVAHVSLDEVGAGRMAVEHLYERGVRKIWFLADADAKWSVQKLRLQGMTESSAALGLPTPFLIHVASSDVPDSIGAYERVRDALIHCPAPEGLIAVRDVLAYGALRAFSEAGLRVGHDVGVVGHDDLWPSAVTWPPLTTIVQPIQRIGSLAADIIIDAIEGNPRPAIKVVFQPELKMRESTHSLSLPAGLTETPKTRRKSR